MSQNDFSTTCFPEHTHLLPHPTACFALIRTMAQKGLLGLHLKGCGCSRSGTPRTAAHWVQWSLQWRSLRFRCCCCCCSGMSSPCRPGTRTLPSSRGGGCGGHPASPAADRTEALYSCTSCCKDAPCLCCCSQRKTEGTVLGATGLKFRLVSLALSSWICFTVTSLHSQINTFWGKCSIRNKWKIISICLVLLEMYICANHISMYISSHAKVCVFHVTCSSAPVPCVRFHMPDWFKLLRWFSITGRVCSILRVCMCPSGSIWLDANATQANGVCNLHASPPSNLYNINDFNVLY